jgi:SAM-dependent methyltransferase
MIRSLEQLVARLPGWRTLRRTRTLRRALGFEDTIWTRKVADEEVRKLVRALDPAPRSALEISGRVWEGHGFPEYRSTSYPEYDVTAAPLEERFDLVIAEHVLEHLRHPSRAARNVLRMLRPGGAFLVVTPFLYRVHPCPDDCTRWTGTGLAHFLAEAGFPLEQTHTGAWGNRACIRSTFTTREHRSYNRWAHKLRNEPEYPVVVWALARAPA